MASATRRGQPTARSLHTHTHTPNTLTHSHTPNSRAVRVFLPQFWEGKSKRRDKTAVQQDTNTAVWYRKLLASRQLAVKSEPRHLSFRRSEKVGCIRYLPPLR